MQGETVVAAGSWSALAPVALACQHISSADGGLSGRFSAPPCVGVGRLAGCGLRARQHAVHADLHPPRVWATPRLAPDSWTSRPTAPTHPWSRRASVVRAARRCATPFWWTVESLTNHDTSVSRYSTGAEGCSRRGASAGTVPDVFRLPVTATLSDGNSRGAPGARATSEDARWRPPVLILVPPLL